MDGFTCPASTSRCYERSNMIHSFHSSSLSLSDYAFIIAIIILFHEDVYMLLL